MPIAVRNSESTITTLVKDVIMIRIEGAMLRTVMRAIICRARSVMPVPSPRSIEISCAKAVGANRQMMSPVTVMARDAQESQVSQFVARLFLVCSPLRTWFVSLVFVICRFVCVIFIFASFRAFKKALLHMSCLFDALLTLINVTLPLALHWVILSLLFFALRVCLSLSLNQKFGRA